MFRQILLFVALFSVAFSDLAPVPTSSSVQSEDGSFQWKYETSDQSQHQEGRQLPDGLNVQGKYQYTDKDGNEIIIQYVANHEGYHPSGGSLPKAPPVPPHTLRGLEHNAAHPEEDQLV
ncbi:hypothetical protein ABEB36_002935 [Hypothenemus hampei]|uniref:Uncharacterized protein n=1 Tax=Hypothenemus hampei TaxID=57062 RepID=A0ABD1F7G7_HYPHA